MNVLVAGDDIRFRHFVRRALVAHFGCAVTEAGNGREALLGLERDRFDLMVVEDAMPVMGGHDMLRELRASTPFTTMPVVILNGDPDEGMVRQAIDLGVLDYLLTTQRAPYQFVERMGRVFERIGPACLTAPAPPAG